MKKVVAFLLALIIFVAPVTTLVKADVVIGDNDDTIINENATILGRKLALMESLSDLALSGVTEYTISNTNDVDSYLDSLWSEVNDAIDYLDSGEWVNDINSQLASKYFTNLVQYKDYINNRGDYFAHLLPSGNPTSNLLSTFFANNIFGKHSTLHSNLSLDAFRSLSSIRRNESANPDPDFSFISNINNIYVRKNSDIKSFYDFDWFYNHNLSYRLVPHNALNTYSYIINNYQCHLNNSNAPQPFYCNIANGIIDIYVTYTEETDINVLYSSYVKLKSFDFFSFPNGNYSLSNDYAYEFTNEYNVREYASGVYCFGTQYDSNLRTNFDSLSVCINYLYNTFANVNLYVNGVPWALVTSNSNSPTLDIDGFLKLYGNDNPQQYELQPNTQIDYDQLYQVIYNAIRDNLPISQGDINYYDSHDTIYSPTIINNYGEEEGDESDLIDSILDYAVIPKFDTAIAQPMRNALTNGVLVMNTSITNVIPNEILLVLGACFFLLLFAVVINRMIK